MPIPADMEGLSMIVAKWRGDMHLLKDVDAQKVAMELRQLGDNFKPEQMVAFARNENTELHKCFEWDDTKAAELYRLKQARTVVSCLVIKETDAAPEKPPVRVFYGVKKDEESGFKYMETQRIVVDEDAYSALLKQAKRELRIFLAKYERIGELREIMEAIDGFLRS